MACFVYNEAAYDQVDFDIASNKAAIRRRKESRKQPTSVALDPELITELRAEAKARGVPYQVLMRMFIIDGFRRLKRAS